MKYALICIALLLARTVDGSVLEDVGDAVDDTVDSVGDFVEDTVDVVGDFVSDTADSLLDAIVQGASDTIAFLASTHDEVTIDVIDSIQTVATLSSDLIDDIPDQIESFSEDAWKTVSNGAKQILSNLPSAIQELIAEGVNALSNFLQMSLLPFPLDVIKDDDFSTVVDCFGDAVLDAAQEWTQEVAATFTAIPDDFQPIFNTKPIEKELNETFECLHHLIADVQNRKRSRRLLPDFLSFFEFDELVISVTLSMMGCRGRCITAALGFAISAEDSAKWGFFFDVGFGLDSSHMVGGAMALSVGIHPNFGVISGTSVGVSVGGDAPFGGIVSVDLFPDFTMLVSVGDDLSVGFVGFAIDTDISIEPKGAKGAKKLVKVSFSLAGAVHYTIWLSAISDKLDEQLNGKRRILQSVSKTAYDTVTQETLGSGGYYAKISENEMVSMSCPSQILDDSIGTANMVELGAIEIYEVIYGNLEGDNTCNSTYGYSAVTEKCLYESNCSFSVNAETLGDIECTADETHLTLMYGCPNQFNVYNLGCYSIDFWTAVDANWIQDYKHEALDDGWYDRSNMMTKCAIVARENGYLGFAMYNNGMCLMATDLLVETDIHEHLVRINESDECASNGLGDDVSLTLYAFAETDFAYEDFGCINKTQIDIYNEAYEEELESTFVTFEGQHYLFLDPYKQRRSALTKCAQIAFGKGFKGFALFDGGKCYLSNSFREDIIQKIWNLTDVDHTIRLSCGKGTDFAYNVFQFPYDMDSETQEKGGLTIIEIVAIIVGSVGVILIGIGVYCGYKCWIKKAAKHDFDCQCPICTKANMERQIKSRTPSTQASTNHDAEDGRTGTETEAVNKLKIQELEHQNS